MRNLINDGLPFRGRDHAAAGLASESDLRRSIAQKQIRGVFKSVYVDARVPDTRLLRVRATRLVTPPHAILSDCFAAWLFGVDTFRPSERHLLTPTLVTPHGVGRVRADGVTCRQAFLADPDVTEVDGIRVTSPLRTTSDLLRRQRRPYALASADGMARAELVDIEQLVDYVDELKGYRGGPQARELARFVDPGAESPGESWQRLRMLDAGFPRPQTQILVTDAWGRDRRFDMGYLHLLLAAEYDGREFHTGADSARHDEERRTYFERRYGWRFVIGTRETIFGTDPAFELAIGELLGITPLARRW
ncbi:hypothetical protein KV097_15935 [Mumia sp. zg.B17]|uniref:hypothetical protein n=1 Tax=Mumia sp. zg.B17 TaxID=2855446 RepID=UPI001C6DF01E|nr:hypothetical protein [Mumia sp. zg.B17]MBW9207433.1 hypothetical protein [Mumia sp. zg.B17]